MERGRQQEVYCRHCGVRLRRLFGRWFHVRRLGRWSAGVPNRKPDRTLLPPVYSLGGRVHRQRGSIRADAPSVNSPRSLMTGDHWSTGSATDAVADVCGIRRVDHPNDLQLDLRRQHVEQSTATAEQHRDLVNLQLVQHTGFERPLRGLDPNGSQRAVDPGTVAFLIGQPDPPSGQASADTAARGHPSGTRAKPTRTRRHQSGTTARSFTGHARASADRRGARGGN
jgi:hypothetical protein